MKTFFRAAKFELGNRKIGTTWSARKLTVFSDIIFREENVSYWFQKAVTQKENYHLKIKIRDNTPQNHSYVAKSVLNRDRILPSLTCCKYSRLLANLCTEIFD